MVIITGTNLNNTLTGTDENDIIFGKAGNDTISGLGGDDGLFGEAGDDTINGNNGNDFLDGGNGSDNIDGGNGNNLIFGGNGNDILGVGFEIGNFTNFIFGGNGDDSLRGGNGSETLYGEDGNDYLFGFFGNDTLNGGAGNDRLEGSFISSGLNEIDRLTGGTGTDTFVLAGSGGAARSSSYIRGGNTNYALITDFNKSEDKIELATEEGDNRQAVEIKYSLGAAPSGLPGGTGIYVDNLGLGAPDLIAILQGVEPSSVSLSQPYFQFVF